MRAADAVAADTEIKGYKKSIYELALDGSKRGEIGIVPIKSGKLPRELLRSTGVYVVDSGFQLYLWVGASAAFPLRISAFVFAQAYLKRFERPSILPLTRYAEGQESEAFWWLFERPVGYRIDADPSKDPKRFHPMMRHAPKPKKTAKPQYAQVHTAAETPAAEPSASPATEAQGTPQPARAAAPAATPLPDVAKQPGGGGTPTDEAAESDDEDEGPPPPDWRFIPWQDKLRCYEGTCYPVVSDAWGCCLTSLGCSWSDRVACCGMDLKGAPLDGSQDHGMGPQGFWGSLALITASPCPQSALLTQVYRLTRRLTLVRRVAFSRVIGRSVHAVRSGRGNVLQALL